MPRMLRARLFANLLFNLLLALWVFRDARSRGAGKPAFAAFLVLLWGPLGLAFWASERPLGMGELRVGGSGWVMARTFVATWSALVPAIFILVVPDIRERAAVPGSLGATLGVTTASALVTLAIWVGPAAIAGILGAVVRQLGQVETGTTAATPRWPPLGSVIVAAAAAAALFAWTR
jgi:hypothetical protein